MKLIIDINDNEYLGIKNYPDNITSYPVTIHLYEAVRNGTPLPKGHGRLIDADAFIQNESCCGYIEDMDIDYFKQHTPTIIEADKAESEDMESVDNSIKNNTTNDKKLIYTFSKKKLTEDKMKEIGDKEAVDKYGTILDVRKEGSV